MSSESVLGKQTSFNLIQAAHAVRRSFELLAHELELSYRQLQILALIEREGPMSQRELSRLAGIDKSPMVGIIDALETAGLALRKRDPEDRRITLIQLTEEGTALLRRAATLALEADKEVLKGLDRSDRLALARLLDRIVNSSGADL